MRKALLPGSFDPFTKGHLDIVERASRLFDEVLILIGFNSSKNYLFTPDERVDMIKKSVENLSNVSVDKYSGLTVDYAEKNGFGYIVRGIRDSVDFSYENELEENNLFINPRIETVYLFSRSNNAFIRSSSIKEMLKYDVDCSSLLPEAVNEFLSRKFLKQ